MDSINQYSNALDGEWKNSKSKSPMPNILPAKTTGNPTLLYANFIFSSHSNIPFLEFKTNTSIYNARILNREFLPNRKTNSC
jgi:hypothetical protein